MKNKPKKKKVKVYGEEEAKTQRRLIDAIADDTEDTEMLVADGFDAAIIGYTEGMEAKVVYDWAECVNILIMRDGMTEEDALEHMSFNVTGSYVGPRTPIFIHLL